MHLKVNILGLITILTVLALSNTAVYAATIPVYNPSTTRYKVLLVGIEKYNGYASDTMYTIDAVYAVHDTLVGPSSVLADDIYTDNAAHPALFWTTSVGGVNILNNYDYVVFAGHGQPYKIFFGITNTTSYGDNLNSAWFYTYNGLQMIYSTRVNWFILLACSVLNVTQEEFNVMASTAFQGGGGGRDTYLHGIAGAASTLFDRWYEYDNGFLGAGSIGASAAIIPAIKNTAERFSEYIVDGRSVPDAWVNAVLETQRFEIGDIEINATPAYIYVYLEVTYIDPFSHTTYHVTYNYSYEGFPGYGVVYGDPALYLSSPFVYNYVLNIVYVEYNGDTYVYNG